MDRNVVSVALNAATQGKGAERWWTKNQHRRRREVMALSTLAFPALKQCDYLEVLMMSGYPRCRLGKARAGYMSATCRIKAGESDRVG